MLAFKAALVPFLLAAAAAAAAEDSPPSADSAAALHAWYDAVADIKRDCGPGNLKDQQRNQQVLDRQVLDRQGNFLGPVALAVVPCDEAGARYDYMLKVV